MMNEDLKKHHDRRGYEMEDQCLGEQCQGEQCQGESCSGEECTGNCNCSCSCAEEVEDEEELEQEACTCEKQEEAEKITPRKKDKKEKKEKKDEKIEELTDQVRRQMAEFDNFRKRSEKEKCQMFEIGVKSIVEKILPVIDNFERGLTSVPEELQGSSYVEGMDKIYRQLISELESVGVKAIEAVGNEFDPFYHNAVMHVEDEEINENIVVEEFQKGYVYRETVVRHSMVKVAN